MSLDNYKLIFRQYTIENIEKNRCFNNIKGTYIHIYHKWGYHVFLSLYEEELNLLLSLLQCTKDELKFKKVIGVEFFGENVAIGYDNKYILFRDLAINGNNLNKLLSLDDLCKELEVFNYTALGDNEEEIDINILLMKCRNETRLENSFNNVKVLHKNRL